MLGQLPPGQGSPPSDRRRVGSMLQMTNEEGSTSTVRPVDRDGILAPTWADDHVVMMIGRMCPEVLHRGGSTRQLQLSMTGWRSPSGRDSQTASELPRSQGGHMASSPFTTPPASFHARFDPQLFRVLLLRRLWQPLPPVSRVCEGGRPLDSSFHHRAACANSGVLGEEGLQS